MALGISIEGRGVIANCDSLVNDTGGDGLGDWTEQGGGTMSLTTDVFLFGSSSIAGKYASKSGLQQFDLGVGNELDFTSGGAEEDQFIYMWVNLSTFGVLDILSNNALALRISSASPGTTNYHDYTIAGSDGSNGWTGGWKCFVLDPIKPPTVINGTLDLSAVRSLGVWIDTAASVRAESLFIDQIAVGSGIRITGTTTNGWEEVVDYCTDYVNRAWGMFQERDGIYYSLGKSYVGSSAQTSTTSFVDESRVIQYATSQYYDSGATWTSTFSLGGSGVVIEDSASFGTTFTDGAIVGSDNGRSGSVIIGNADQDISLELLGENSVTSTTKFYGTIVKNVYGIIQNGDTNDNDFLGSTFAGAGDIFLGDTMTVSNSLFVDCTKLYQSGATMDSISVLAANTADGVAFIESNNPELISNSSFTFSTGHSIEMTTEVVSAFTFTKNLFTNYGASGTTSAAIYNNSGKHVIINVSEGDTPTIRNGAGATTEVNNTVKLTLTELIDDTEVRIYESGTIIELDGLESVSGGSFVYSYTFGIIPDVDIVIFKEDYLFNEPEGRLTNFTLASTNAILPIKQSFDRNYFNPI